MLVGVWEFVWLFVQESDTGVEVITGGDRLCWKFVRCFRSLVLVLLLVTYVLIFRLLD